MSLDLQRSGAEHDDPPKVLEPSKEALDLPPPSVLTQWATVLRPLLPSPPMGSDELHTLVCQFRVQSVRLIGVIADETGWKLLDEPISKRRVYQFDLGRGALDVNGDRTPVTIRDGHDQPVRGEQMSTLSGRGIEAQLRWIDSCGSQLTQQPAAVQGLDRQPFVSGG